MKDGRNIFNMKNEDSMRNFSQRLLIAFNDSQYRLECQFICLKCLGISVNPLYCRHCKYSYCGGCIQFVPASKIICLCRKPSKQNFGFQINQELFNTYYCIQGKSTLQKSQICYPDSLNWQNESPYVFVPSENADPTTEAVGEYNKTCQDINLQVSRHQCNYMHPFSLKEARLISFNFAKGYSLKLEGKVLCANEGNLLRAIHLAKIELICCYWNLDFSFSLNKAIRRNQDKIKVMRVGGYYGERINLKSFLIICNALTFCSKLEIIDFYGIISQDFGGIQIPKSFYEFLSNSYFLKEIKFDKFVFYDDMNFKPFQRLLSLQTLALRECKFDFNSFELMNQNNFPKLQILYLWGNQITNSFTGEKMVPANPFPQKSFKPPSKLTLIMVNSGNSLENLLFETLIKSESIKLMSLAIWFNKLWKSKPIPPFLKFLKVSSIQFLTLRSLYNPQGFDSYEFCEFLRNSKFLQGLCMDDSNKDDFNAGLVLQALSMNKSIKVLYLTDMKLSTFISVLINLILSNQVITILNLYWNYIPIDVDFINALSKNKSVFYLDLRSNKINDEDAVMLSELSLKGINVYHTGISKSTKEMIYKKIPKFKAPRDILGCEKFLKEEKVN